MDNDTKSIGKARRDSWKTEPLPEARREIPYSEVFSEEEYGKISKGFVPEEMEDKWFAFLEDDVLHVHRSWTGYCIYEVRFREDGGKRVVAQALVNRDPSQYGETDEDYDAELLSYVIRQGILGQRLQFPRKRRRSWWRFW